jgi:hypothetical protein
MSDVSRPRDYEKADADPRLVGALALGLAIFLLLTPFMLMVLYPDAPDLGGIPSSQPPPAPRLQVDPRADLDALRVAERHQLTTYGWVNRERRVAHIPIEQAMQLLSERGLPGWPQASNPPPPPR